MIPPNWANADIWSTLVVAGMASPGVVTISGHTREVGWDVQDAKGQEGATTTRKGGPIAKFTATFYLVDELDANGYSDFDYWPAFQALIESSFTGAEPVALEVYHPDLARNYITAAVLAKMGPMVPDGKGGATIAVDMMQYRPKKPKASGSASTTKTKTAGDQAVADAEAELNALLKEGESL
jgi:hypothetical protein